MQTLQKMPVIFSGHGSPMNAIGTNKARAGWQKIGETLPKPKVIIAVSAHWATRGFFVRDRADNPQIYDMYGFPKELYQIHYEPSGSPSFAKRIQELLPGQVSVKDDWGIDHGVWSILVNMFPKTNIPVVMVSTDISASPSTLFAFGKNLAPLREEGALILASGNVVHNLSSVSWDRDGGYSWADTFDTTIRDAILSGDFLTPVNFTHLPGADKAVPTVEHYYPLLVALGAATPSKKITVWNEYRELGSMSMTSYTFEN